MGLERADIRAGRSLRATWVFFRDPGPGPDPVLEVYYAHLDRFLLHAAVGCGDSVSGSEIAPEPEPVDSSIWGAPAW